MSTLSERLREATRDVVTGEKLMPGIYGHAPIEDITEAADELDRLTARVAELESDLRSCRGTVKTELNHYERLAVVHGKTPLAHSYETEAQRLSDLLDKIDALESKHG